MQREIGSNFWLSPNEVYEDVSLGSPEIFGCKGPDYVWLSSGRSAIRLVLEAIEDRNRELRKTVVLPSFTCHTVFEPFLKKGYDVYYYPVGKDLKTTADAIMAAVKEHDATIVLFHRYFGFDTLDGDIDYVCDKLRSEGIYSIEDCTQCLYSNIPRAKSDFTVGSIRKWTGVPDGGFAVCRSGSFNNKPQKPDMSLEKAKIEASYGKYRFLFENQGEKSDFLQQYRVAEDILARQADFFAIADFSVKVQSNLNVGELREKRIGNFNFLSNSIKAPVVPLFTNNSSETVPLYYPILVEERYSLQQHLVKNNIYAPVVWPKDELQPAQCDGAEYLYNHLLCIPIDQRYDEDDMNRVSYVINNFYK